MKKLSLDLKNCHGISSLKYDFHLKENYIIYATNGSMKTSLYKTFHDYINGTESKDLFFPNRKSSRIITDENGKQLDPSMLLLVGNQDFVIEDFKMTSLLINEKLKKEYDSIFNKLNIQEEKIKKKIKSKTGETIETLFNDIGLKNLNEFDQSYFCEDIINFDKIKYQDIFNDDNIKILNQKLITESIKDYMDICNEIVNQNGIFINDIFELYHLKNIAKSLKANNYFLPGHLIKLKCNDTYNDFDEEKIHKLIDNIEIQLQEDSRIAAVNLSLNSKISSRKLKTFLSANQWIIPLLNDIEKLKKEYWKFCVGSDDELKVLILEYVKLYDEHRETLEQIIKKSRSEDNLKKWSEAVEEFNRKFVSMPFKLEVGNLSDVILKDSACSLVYKYSDKRETNEINEQILKDNLSKGERNAFNILNLIFEIQYRKTNGIESLIIVDDIADSFDYKNKYAIIEFLKKIADNNLFHLIILTHNFDFYRTCSSRIGLKKLSVIKTQEIKLVDFYYTKNIFNSYKDKLDDKAKFLAAIPFVRNIVELTKSDKDDDYLELTNLLHYKKTTSQITTKKINDIFLTTINRSSNINDNYLSLLYDTADTIKADYEKINLENKLILSIAIRIKFEEYLFKKINSWDVIDSFESNQTKKMIDYCIERSLLDNNELEIAEKVRIMISENIHVNAFMYEPIIDMTDDELISLYLQIKKLYNK